MAHCGCFRAWLAVDMVILQLTVETIQSGQAAAYTDKLLTKEVILLGQGAATASLAKLWQPPGRSQMQGAGVREMLQI